MFNYYIFNPSYENVETKLLEDNLKILQSIFVSRKSNEYFLKHDSIWDVVVAEGMFSEVAFSKFEDKQFSNLVLPKLLEQIKSVEAPIKSIDDFNSRYRIYNAFYGINFQGITAGNYVCNLDSYKAFFENNNWALNPQTFWERRAELFSRVIFCQCVESQIHSIGGTYLEQIINKIRELENYLLVYWGKNDFNYRDANKNTSLNISPESHTTMRNRELVNMRKFKLPDGRIECFELHIKTGDLRFHFYPDNLKVYIGYIGKHLKTSGE